MSWVHLGDVWAFDLNGTTYALLGRVYYDNVQDIANNRTLMKIDAFKHAAGGLFDTDVRGWGVNVNAVPAATGLGRASGSAAPNFAGMSNGQLAALGSSGNFYVTHKADGTAAVSLVASWDATSSGSYFDAGFSGTAGPLSLPTIPRGPKTLTGTGFKATVWKVFTALGWKSLRWRQLTPTGWKDLI